MKKHLTRKIVLPVLFSLLGVCPYHASAAETDLTEFSLTDYVVTVSRVQTQKVDTPANIYVIGPSKLEQRNYANAGEALAEVPGVSILRAGSIGANMGQDVITINGDERVLVLIDGRRVNMASSGNYSADWLPPVDTIERIEVMKGAGSAIYGTDAVGGVINIITKSGDVEQGNVRMAAGSWNTEQYALNYGGRKDGTGVFVGVSKERRGNFSYKDNLDGKKKTMENSGYDTVGANIKIDRQLGKDNRLTFQFEHLLAEGGSPFGYYGYGNTDSHERLNNNVALRYDWHENKATKGFVQVYQNYQHAYFYSPDSSNVSNFTNKKTGFEAQQNWVLAENNELTGGLEYYKDVVDNSALYGVERNVNTKSVYLEDRWKFAASWQLNSGVRYDKHSRYGSEVTPHFALNKKFSEDSNAYLSWSKVFNAPTTDDLFWYQPGTYPTYGDPNLKPEKGYVLTLGYNTVLGEKTRLSASVFRSKIKDAIDWIYGPSWETLAANINSEKRRGAELSVEHELNAHWSLNASYTYLRVEQDFADGSGYLRYGAAQPNLYRAGVQYQDEKWSANVTMRAATGLVDNYTGKYGAARAYADNSYFTWDLGVQYKVNKQMKVYAQLNNISDKHYQEYNGLYADGQIKYPMASRNFVIGMNYTF